MRIYHPDLLPDTPPGLVPQRVYEKVWRARGWLPAPSTDIPVGELTIAEIKDAITDDDEALAVLFAEKARGDDLERSTLVDYLQSQLSDTSDSDSEEE